MGLWISNFGLMKGMLSILYIDYQLFLIVPQLVTLDQSTKTKNSNKHNDLNHLNDPNDHNDLNHLNEHNEHNHLNQRGGKHGNRNQNRKNI